MKITEDTEPDLLPEYSFDYSKAKPNRFASAPAVTVTLDADVAAIFTNAESVNKALRAILSALPNAKPFSV